jgi:hypothetical protein
MHIGEGLATQQPMQTPSAMETAVQKLKNNKKQPRAVSALSAQLKVSFYTPFVCTSTKKATGGRERDTRMTLPFRDNHLHTLGE